MIKKWKVFNEELIDNSPSLIDAKMQELNDLVKSIGDENSSSMIYEWENKDDHHLIINFTKDDLSIKYEFNIDDLYISKFAGDVIDFEKSVESVDEGLDIIEGDIHLILDISEKINNSKMRIIKEFKNFNPNPEYRFPQLDDVESNNDELDREEMEEPLEVISGFEEDELEDMSDEELEDMYSALEKDVEKRNEGFIKTFESFNEDASR